MELFDASEYKAIKQVKPQLKSAAKVVIPNTDKPEVPPFLTVKDKHKALRNKMYFMFSDTKIAPTSKCIFAYETILSYGIHYLKLPYDIRVNLQLYAHSDNKLSKKLDSFLHEIKSQQNNPINQLTTQQLLEEIERRQRLQIE